MSTTNERAPRVKLEELRARLESELVAVRAALTDLGEVGAAENTWCARFDAGVLRECGAALARTFEWRLGQKREQLLRADELAELERSALVHLDRLIIRIERTPSSDLLCVLPVPQDLKGQPDFRASGRRAAHDFNNVLTTILGYAELGTMLSSDARLSGYFSEILQTSRRGQSLVKSFQELLQGVTETKSGQEDKDSILIVDDDLVTANALSELLKRNGLAVTAAYSGDEAWTVFSANPGNFDLLLCDYSMPGMNGIDLIARIQRRRPDLPTILCTGWGDSLESRELASVRIHRLVAKPVEEGKLLSLVRALLEGDPAKNLDRGKEKVSGASLTR